MAVSQNGSNFSRRARYDKVRMLFPGHDENTMHKIYTKVFHDVQDLTGWSDEYTRRHIKVSPYWVDGSRRGYYMQLTYKACDVVFSFPFARAVNLTECEVKAYIGCKDGEEGNYYWFLDAIGTQPGRLNRNNMVNGSHSSKRKGGATRSMKIGSNKSDTQSGVYKRQGEKPGLEVSVKRRKLQRCVNDVASTTPTLGVTNADAELWARLLLKVATVGFAQFESELARLGVELRDYFEHFTTETEARNFHPHDALPIHPNTTAFSVAQDWLDL